MSLVECGEILLECKIYGVVFSLHRRSMGTQLLLGMFNNKVPWSTYIKTADRIRTKTVNEVLNKQ